MGYEMIRFIQYMNDIVLGNLNLDLSPQGKGYNTIILAGENGCGKTRILDTLCRFLNLESMLPINEIKYNIGNEIFKIKPTGPNYISGFHTRINMSTGEAKNITSNKHMDTDSINEDKKDIRHYGFSYSKSRSGFKTTPIKATTTKNIDTEKYEADETDNFTQIKQLLIDIKQRDNSDWANISNAGSSMSYAEFKKIYQEVTGFLMPLIVFLTKK